MCWVQLTTPRTFQLVLGAVAIFGVLGALRKFAACYRGCTKQVALLGRGSNQGWSFTESCLEKHDLEHETNSKGVISWAFE